MKKPKKILLVENDSILSSALGNHLFEKGFQVSLAVSIKEAINLIDRLNFDLAIIDRCLDDGDGFDVVEYLTLTNLRTRILMLTRKNQVLDRVNGLSKGADDYLGKPFDLVELMLRINRLLGVEKKLINKEVKAGKLVFDTEIGVIKAKKLHVQLRYKESKVFTCLIRHQNSIVSRRMLVEYVWQDSQKAPTPCTVDVYVRRIRMKMGNYGKQLKTVRNFGYTLVS